MGKKDKQSSKASTEELLTTLELGCGDFTSKENWDKFITIRSAIHTHTPSGLSSTALSSPFSPQMMKFILLRCKFWCRVAGDRSYLRIYTMPGSGHSNIDSSKVVIYDVLTRRRRIWYVFNVTIKIYYFYILKIF